MRNLPTNEGQAISAFLYTLYRDTEATRLTDFEAFSHRCPIPSEKYHTVVRKKKISVTLDPSIVGELSDQVGSEYENRSEAVGDLLTTALSVDDRVDEYEERIAELEQEVERLHRERRQLLEQREENQELVRFAESQRELAEYERERQKRGVFTRFVWWLRGQPD